ncbi:MAG: prolipoprotein diacylglyceryl transferase [Desulfobacula sp.]|nr:prolipoprotein diacylglyceryl transferase [Desulfobacula sp.]
MINLADTHWWTRLPYSVSPFLFEFNGFGIRYYSLMYILAFLTVYLLIRHRLKTESFRITNEHLDDFIVWAAMGVLLGGRLGYVLFYNLSFFISHPFQIFLPFETTNGFRFTGISGMSYHGGLIGVAVAVVLFCRKNKINPLEFSDLFCPAVPLGYTFGRLGNFFNSELYGRATTLPVGMIFPTDPSHTLRHPSQLYEAFFEGIVLFAILWTLRKKTIFKHRMFGLYLIGYGLFRFFIEFVRMPDAHLNFVLLNFTMGQILCALMITAGTLLVILIKPQPS